MVDSGARLPGFESQFFYCHLCISGLGPEPLTTLCLSLAVKQRQLQSLPKGAVWGLCEGNESKAQARVQYLYRHLGSCYTMPSSLL